VWVYASLSVDERRAKLNDEDFDEASLVSRKLNVPIVRL
jgi:hypothetical protein